MRRALVTALGLVALASARPAPALAAPEWTGSVGHSFAVTGEPADGGWSLSLGALWPVDIAHLSFGATVFADDAGARFTRLHDANDSSLDLGQIETGHRAALGAAWRADARAARKYGWEPFGSATWGVYRVQDDRRGKPLSRIGSTGFSLAGGVRRPFGERSAIGVSIRYHRLANDLLGRYVSAGVDWSWRGSR